MLNSFSHGPFCMEAAPFFIARLFLSIYHFFCNLTCAFLQGLYDFSWYPRSTECGWTVMMIWLNCLLNVAELSTGSSYMKSDYWTVYCVTQFLLNCLLVVLNVAELLQALAELYTGWFYPSWAVCWVTRCIWTVYWVTRFWLNCLLIVLNIAELSQALAQGDFTLTEL